MDPNFSVDQIMGQEVASIYANAYLKAPHKLPPLLIFHGPDGVGKWSMVERFSRQLLCNHGDNCGHCDSCKAFMNNNHPDYIEFPYEERIGIGAEKDPEEFTIRWLITKRLYYRPHLSSIRLIIFPNALLINDEAESALLKSLEEPPTHSRFIFIVNNLQLLKQTIISRGVCIPFHYISQKSIAEICKIYSFQVEEYFGGSLNPYEVPAEVLFLIKDKVSGLIHSPLQLLELETWIRFYKDHHPEWTEDFSYKEFLELVCLLMIHYYYKSNMADKFIKIDHIFRFKEDLHKSIPNLEPFILGKLFYELAKS